MMNRRDFLRRTIPLTVCIPASGGIFALLKNYFLPPKPDLRQIGFSIKENLGFLVSNPSGVQRLTVPMFEIYSCPTIALADIKNRRFQVHSGGSLWLDKDSSMREVTTAGQLSGDLAPGCLSI